MHGVLTDIITENMHTSRSGSLIGCFVHTRYRLIVSNEILDRYLEQVRRREAMAKTVLPRSALNFLSGSQTQLSYDRFEKHMR